MDQPLRTSRLPGFKDQSPADRGRALAASTGLTAEQLLALDGAGGLTLEEPGADLGAQRLVMEQEIFACAHPAASVRAEPAAGNEVMDVRMKDQRARPGVKHPEHAQLRAQPARVARQILQGL